MIANSFNDKTVQVQDITGQTYEINQEHLLRTAKLCIRDQFRSNSTALTSPQAARDLVQVLIGAREHEVFMALWLDTRHRVIAHEILFRGTIDQANVYPREVVKAALSHNAAAVIVAHNHPSGSPEPSAADIAITRKLRSALELVEVRLLDHLIAGESVVSLAERGLV